MEKVSYKMKVSVTGHILALDLKSMKLLQSMSPTWLPGENCVLDLIKIKPLIKFLRENLRKKRTIGGKFC
jgi:hypothetical protein